MWYTVHKIFWAWQHDKEENWINQMSAKGFQLVDVGFCRYSFEQNSNDTYTYRLELLNNWPTHAESKSYIGFIEETGAEYVGSLMRWVYFRKKTSDGKFEIYSDNASKIKHLTRIWQLLWGALIIIILNSSSTIHRFIDSYEKSYSSIMLALVVLQLAVVAFLITGIIGLHLKLRNLKKEQNYKE